MSGDGGVVPGAGGGAARLSAPPVVGITPTTPVDEVPGLAPRHVKALARAGFNTVGDLVYHYPRRYEDRRHFDAFPDGELDAPVCLHGVVADTSLRRYGRRSTFEAVVVERGAGDLGARVVCRWFNLSWIAKAIAVDQEIVLFGRPKRSGKRIVVDHPDYELVDPSGDCEPGAESVHMGRITPVYPLTDGIKQKALRESVFRALEGLDPGSVPDVMPEPSPEGPFAGLGRAAALRSIHFPSSHDELALARRYLALEEFFVLQLSVLSRKRARAAAAGEPRCGAGHLWQDFLQGLPFEPTGAQLRSVEEVKADLAAPHPMNRLLQGDVGAGKTLVAAAAVLHAVESGAAAALMAPTQILAEQHHRTFRRWFEPLGLRVDLRTGGRTSRAGAGRGRGRRNAGGEAGAGSLPGLEERPPDLVVGTHALLYGDGCDGGTEPPYGLVVIDEQHKFGVAQRGALIGRGAVPDVLVMTATPIPRTLTMTVYGDLDVSVIDELPPGRGAVTTAVRSGVDRSEIAKFVNQKLAEGRQAYLVYPLIDESESLSAEAAAAEFEGWENLLAPHRCGLLHGRLPAVEKDEVMAGFRSGEIGALVATTVIEVGVDVPNATVMLVFSAERFGLAQLHQLRGRIGRGSEKSYCILFTDGKNPASTDRLQVLEATRDGFEVAEEDLRLRGPGDVLGTAQSGLSGLRLGDLVTDTALVRTARRLAEAVLERDPELASAENAHRRALVDAVAAAGATPAA